MSSAFHPQTDGQSERTILTIEDILRACILEWQGEWHRHLPLVEFTYNNSYHVNIKMTPFEALYGRPCRALKYWSDIADVRFEDPLILQHYADQVHLIRERMQTARHRQKYYAERRRRALDFEVGDSVFLKISHTKGVFRFEKKGKLSPRFIGPFEKYLPDLNRQVEYTDVKENQRLNVPEERVRIIDEQVKRLKNK
ncbi:unnamed protein product [Victoria cruziana]